jgi:hypothetical protein
LIKVKSEQGGSRLNRQLIGSDDYLKKFEEKLRIRGIEMELMRRLALKQKHLIPPREYSKYKTIYRSEGEK